MRIIHIINDAALGGAQTFNLQLAESWCDEDELHLVVLLGEGPLSERYERAFDSVRYLDVGSRGAVAAARTFRQHLHALRPHIVHSHLLQSDAVNILLSPRSVMRFSTVHTTGMSAADPLASRMLGRLVGWGSRRLSGVIACDDACLNYMGHNRYRSRSAVITNGVSLPDPVPYDPQSRTMISLARLHPMKDHATLLRAFVGASGSSGEVWRLRCFGEGVTPFAPALRDVLQEPTVRRAVEDGRISLNGPTLSAGSELMGAAGLVISSAYGEASPMVAIEAGARGVPIVSTSVGGAAGLVQSPRLIATPGSVSSLRKSLEAFFAMTAVERQRLSTATREDVARKFDIKERVGSYRGFYIDAARVVQVEDS